MLTCAECSKAHRATHEDVVCELEGEGPRGAENLQHADWIVWVVCEDALPHVVRYTIGKILRGFPIHAMAVVHTLVAQVIDVSHHVLSDEGVVPLELVLDHIGRGEAIVLAIVGVLLAA